jgi:hypothetical protein
LAPADARTATPSLPSRAGADPSLALHGRAPAPPTSAPGLGSPPTSAPGRASAPRCFRRFGPSRRRRRVCMLVRDCGGGDAVHDVPQVGGQEGWPKPRRSLHHWRCHNGSLVRTPPKAT